MLPGVGSRSFRLLATADPRALILSGLRWRLCYIPLIRVQFDGWNADDEVGLTTQFRAAIVLAEGGGYLMYAERLPIPTPRVGIRELNIAGDSVSVSVSVIGTLTARSQSGGGSGTADSATRMR